MMQSEWESEFESTVTIDGVDSDAAAARATLFWRFFVPLWAIEAFKGTLAKLASHSLQ